MLCPFTELWFHVHQIHEHYDQAMNVQKGNSKRRDTQSPTLHWEHRLVQVHNVRTHEVLLELHLATLNVTCYDKTYHLPKIKKIPRFWYQRVQNFMQNATVQKAEPK